MWYKNFYWLSRLSIWAVMIHQIFCLNAIGLNWSRDRKLLNIRRYCPSSKLRVLQKNFGRITNTRASILRKYTFGYLSLDIICSSKLKVFLKLRSRKTVRFRNRQYLQTNIRTYFRAIPFKYGKRTRNIYGKILFLISLLYLYFAGEIKKRE